jgi:hypothetical protein
MLYILFQSLNAIIEGTIIHQGTGMKKRTNNQIDSNPDYIRAKILLKNKIHTPFDLIVFWSFSGPCREPHPSIEDISE